MHYSREDACRAWLTHGVLPYDLVKDLLDEYVTAEKLYDEFVKTQGSFLADLVNPDQLKLMREHAAPEAMHQMLLTMQKHDMGIVGKDDPAYPSELLNISDPPHFLFYIGDLNCLNGRCVTMVGSRSASLDALEATRRIARSLSDEGVRIVSGLANGIDQAAHYGCLDGASPTIAVLGCGLDIRYPSTSMELRELIIRQGGVMLSEYPPGTPAIGWHFPVRNRILSGISRAVVMMECRVHSGSMTTVQHALDQGKEVFAWPGRAGTEWAEGAHILIRDGARYFTSASDLMEDLDWHSNEVPTREQAKALPPLSGDQMTIYQQLKRGDQSMDELAFATGLEASVLASSLTILQVYGLVRALPGKQYQAL